MHNENPMTLRRSSRVPVAVPLLVSSLDGTHFSEVCETLVVNAHGCAIRSSAKLDAGVPLQFHSRDGRETTAQVVSCDPIGSGNQGWRLGARLDRPQNFWGLRNCPKDWTLALSSAAPSVPQLRAPAAQGYSQVPALPSRGPEVTAQLSEEHVKKMIAESVRSLHAEVVSLKEKLARSEANRSRFDVSLSSIPPELEQQLEQRLRQDLGPRVLDEARQQSARLLSATEAAIEKRTIEVREEFQSRSTEELQSVENRAHEISARIVENVREHLRDGVGDLQRKLTEGRNQLKRISTELMESLQASLNDEHNRRRGELEQLQSAVAAESARLYEQVEQLDGRIRKLDESVRSLESGLDQRLSQMAGDAVRNTRNEIESVADTMLKQLTARSAQVIGDQMEEAAGNMRIFHQGIIASGSDALKAKAAEALHDFEHSMDELAQVSIERWRQRLASGLTALVNSLGEQFRLQGESGRSGTEQ
jgi:hypothetical protein